MKKSKKKRTRSRQAERQAPVPSVRRPWPWMALIAVALAVSGGIYFWRARMTLQPPEISLAGLDRAVAALVARAVADAKASPRSDGPWGRLGLALQAADFKSEARSCFAQAERLNSAEPRWPYFYGLLLLQDEGQAGIAKLQRAVELARDRSDAPRLQLAQALAEQGRLDEAGRHFLELLHQRADHPMALLGLARASFARGQLEASTQYLRRCLEDVHAAKAAYTLLAAVQQQLGNAPAAQTAARAAASLPPDQPWPDPYAEEAMRYQVGRQAMVDRALQLLKQGRVDEAVPLVTRVVAEYPQDPEARLLLGRLRLLQKDCVAAEQALRLHLQLAPDSVNGHTQLGAALLCQERYAEAVQVFQKLLQLKPDFGEAHFNLGYALGRSGQGTAAMEAFRNAIRYSPNFIDPYITLADLLNQTGRREESLALLQRALALNPSDPRAKALMERVQRGR